ncbi:MULTISPECIES: hypothetical protein [unclassified Streptomyces]|uniref:hypothetical protein n=1 Tax=unclassified Streptomyces TaxID=2593676 RepID=UPI003455D755
MDFTIIKHAVEVDHGIKRFSMRFIKERAAPQRARLSTELCSEIVAELAKMGLTTLPRTLPPSENESIWVIDTSSPLGEVTAVARALVSLDLVGMNPAPQVLDNYPAAKRYLS